MFKPVSTNKLAELIWLNMMNPDNKSSNLLALKKNLSTVGSFLTETPVSL